MFNRRHEERRQDHLSPLRELRTGDDRRGAAPRIPEWRRRALAAREEHGFTAVADLTGQVRVA